jgi:hypothetical protein
MARADDDGAKSVGGGMRRLFLPTARQVNWLLVVGFLSVGQGIYVRVMGIENPNISLACRAGLDTWFCRAYLSSLVMFHYEVFGLLALAVALVNLIRPSVVLLALALVPIGFGLVLENAELSALAAAILILSLARPAPAAE